MKDFSDGAATSNLASKLFGGLAGAFTEFLTFLYRIPVYILFSMPYMLACKLGLDKFLNKYADKQGLNKQFFDPAYVESWARSAYSGSDDKRLDFNARREFAEMAYPEDMLPSAHIPVPPNLERGVLLYGYLFDGKTTKDAWLAGLHYNPTIFADAMFKTRGRAIVNGLSMAFGVSLLLAFLLHSGISFEHSTVENWGGETLDMFSLWMLLSNTFISAIVIGLCLSPFLLVKKFSEKGHFVIATNELLNDIAMQVEQYEGNKPAKETLVGDSDPAAFRLASETLARQRKEFWRQLATGEPMIPFGKDDGTSRARCSIHGYEQGTEMLISLPDANQNSLTTGQIGSGKTTSYLLPMFRNNVRTLLRHGYPVQGMGLDGKATIWRPMMRLLEKEGISTDNFIVIGVDEGQYGIPIFHGLSVEKCIDILTSTQKGESSDPFFIQSAFTHIGRVMHIAKAYHLTELGVKYEIESNGCTVDSPYWIKRMCNNHDLLIVAIRELTEYLSKNPAMRAALYTDSLVQAIDGCLHDWVSMAKSEATMSGVVSSINLILGPFVDNGQILRRFGQGRVGKEYKDISLCLNGYFFFSALADTEFGEAARVINIFARARLYNLITLREIEFKALDKNPQKEPVMLFIDEHAIMTSTGNTASSDAVIMNIARSMGLIFNAYVQAEDAYEMTMSKAQTENMIQQMLTRVFLPSKSERSARWIADNSGQGFRFTAGLQGIASSEGSRELAFGGVMYEPRTAIKELTPCTNLSLPVTIREVDGKTITKYRLNDNEHKLIKLPGYRKTRFIHQSGVGYLEWMNSPTTIQLAEEANFKNRENYTFGSIMGDPVSINYTDGIDQELQGKEADMELRGRLEGVERLPLYTGNDSLIGGNYRAIISIPQYGIAHWCRSEIEPIYI